MAVLTAPGSVYQYGRLLGIPVPNVVRGELKIPFEFPGGRVQSDDRAGVEVVANTLVAAQIGAGVAGGPIKGIELGVVRASEPGSRAGVIDVIALPGLRTGLARFWHC